MKKIWSYLAVGFAFFSAGLITIYKVMGEQTKVTMRKVKFKRTLGDNSVTVPIRIDKAEKRTKRTREEKKADREKRRVD